jgi:hypothetical protein
VNYFKTICKKKFIEKKEVWIKLLIN